MKVGVIMGGCSSEREVSLLTGREMMAQLDSSKYDIVPIELQSKQDLIDQVHDIDVALLALHGKYGEDGTIQGTLESLGVPYTGSSLLSSSLCMDKDMTKKLLRYEGIHTPDWILVSGMEDLNVEEVRRFGYPLIVKPNAGGSSIGVCLVHDEAALAEAVEAAFALGEEVIIERYIGGHEITCGILDEKLLPVISIQPRAELFDYTSKYVQGECVEQVIEFASDIQERIEQAAWRSYKLLKCSVYARIDIIVKDGIPYVIEVNTLPGLTGTSLLPRSAEAAGISFPQMLDIIIEASIQERKRGYQKQ